MDVTSLVPVYHSVFLAGAQTFSLDIKVVNDAMFEITERHELTIPTIGLL